MQSTFEKIIIIIIMVLDIYIAHISTMRYAQGALTITPELLVYSIQGIPAYRYPFNTWVESGKCRLISFQYLVISPFYAASTFEKKRFLIHSVLKC